MAVTLTDVAQRAGVSTATASLVLSGKSQGRVSNERAKEVEKVAAELNYVRNDIALGLRTKKTNTIGVVTDLVATTPYAVDMISAATTEAAKHGYLLIFIETGGEKRATYKSIQALEARMVDGMALAAMSHHEVEVPSNAPEDLIILDGYGTDSTFTSAVPDEVQGAYDAISHLLELGHTKIGFINDLESKDAAPLRLKGFKKAHADNGFEVDESLIIYCPTEDHSKTYAAIFGYLQSENRPTAVFCFNDKTAALVYRAAGHLGLEIPRDLSVVGFDNFQTLTNLLEPGLTTVQLPHAEMATWVIDRLITGESAQSDAPEDNKYLFYCPLVVRESTAPPRNN